MSLDEEARSELETLEVIGRLRGRRTLIGRQGVRAIVDGQPVINFSSNDYLGLAGHPAIEQAAREAAAIAGVGAGASRLVVGNHALHDELEVAIATWLGFPRALLFNSGYAANTGVLPVIARDGDVIFSDELNHASIIDGCRLSRARVVVYRHLDLDDLARKLDTPARRRVVVTETMFSMDGDFPDLAALDRLRRDFAAVLVVDEAHALGVVGRQGLCGLRDVHPDILIGTLGKALGGHGAFAVGSESLIELLWNKSRSLVFSTAMPPMVAAANARAVSIVNAIDGDRRRQKLVQNIEQFNCLEIDRSSSSAIRPIVVNEDARAVNISKILIKSGVLIQAIRPPTVPEGKARLRIALSSSHDSSDIEMLRDFTWNIA